MAVTPQQQLTRLLKGTIGSIVAMAALILTSDWENPYLFYALAILMLLSILYALPGYLGIWLWRMRKFFFDLD